jgi:hypothetical protein
MAGSKAAAPDRRITRAGAKLFNGARVTKPGLIHKRKTSELDAITEAVLPEARGKIEPHLLTSPL